MHFCPYCFEVNVRDSSFYVLQSLKVTLDCEMRRARGLYQLFFENVTNCSG